MKIEFNIKPYQGCMDIKVSYKKEEINQDFFYLNKDFIINKCLADNKECNITENAELFKYEDFWGYEVNKYYLPQSFEQIEIEYTGYLTGKTGSCPYVRETISPEFTFIRWESFCYPLFFDENGGKIHEFLSASANIDIVLEVQDEFIAVSNVDEIASYNENGIRRYKRPLRKLRNSQIKVV